MLHQNPADEPFIMVVKQFIANAIKTQSIAISTTLAQRHYLDNIISMNELS